jgi:hypothetical protein
MADVMVPMAVLNDRSFNPCPPNYEPLGLVSQVRFWIVIYALNLFQRTHTLSVSVACPKYHEPK